MTPKNQDIRQQIGELRKENKIMWRELVDMPDVRFVVNEKKRKHQLDLNAKFRKNEARLERLHKKLDINWVPTTEMPTGERYVVRACIITGYTLVIAALAFFAVQLISYIGS